MSLRRPSLRLAIGLALFVLATTVAPASAAPRQVSATSAPAAFPASSCQGDAACYGAVGPIGENSCNGELACSGTWGAIGDNSCNGYDACEGAEGAIGDNSCNGTQACQKAVGAIGAGSCNAAGACFQAPGPIGNNSCNGEQACFPTSGAIGNCVYNDVEPAACDTQPDARIRRVGRTNLVGNDIYNTDATDQTLTATLKPNDKVRFSITFQNDADVPDSFDLNGPCILSSVNSVRPADSALEIKFVHGWPTEAVSNPTPTIAPGGKYRTRLIVKRTDSPVAASGTAADWTLDCLFTATSVGNPANQDAVRIVVKLPDFVVSF